MTPSAYLSRFFCCGPGYTWLFELSMSTLLAHTQFFIHQQPQVLSWDALCLRIAQLAFVLEILLALGLIELHEVRMSQDL